MALQMFNVLPPKNVKYFTKIYNNNENVFELVERENKRINLRVDRFGGIFRFETPN